MADVLKKNGNVNIKMWITKDRAPDLRRYNLPVATEIAAVFVSEDGDPPINRDICVHNKNDGSVQNIPFYSPNCDPMTYPILFPFGDLGWTSGIPKVGRIVSSDKQENDADEGRKTVSMLEFYSFRLQQREMFCPLLHAGKVCFAFPLTGYTRVSFSYHSNFR